MEEVDMNSRLCERAIQRLFDLKVVKPISFTMLRNGQLLEKTKMVDVWQAFLDPVLLKILSQFVVLSLPPRIGCIVALDGGGIPIGLASSAYHDLPVLLLKDDPVQPDRRKGPLPLIEQVKAVRKMHKSVLSQGVIVDDSICTGFTAAKAEERMREVGITTVTTVVLFRHDLDEDIPVIHNYKVFIRDSDLYKRFKQHAP